jgi:hypothetical protein
MDSLVQGIKALGWKEALVKLAEERIAPSVPAMLTMLPPHTTAYTSDRVGEGRGEGVAGEVSLRDDDAAPGPTLVQAVSRKNTNIKRRMSLERTGMRGVTPRRS